MEKFFTEIIFSIQRYFSVVGLIIFNSRKSAVFLFSPSYNKRFSNTSLKYLFVLFTFLYVVLVRSIRFYLVSEDDNINIVTKELSSYFSNEGPTKALVLLFPFIFLINFICFLFIRNKRYRDKWLNFFLFNFSAQLVLFSTVFAFFVDQGETVSGIVFLILLLLIIRKSYRILDFAEQYQFISNDDKKGGFIFSLLTPIIFLFLINFSQEKENNADVEVFFQNRNNSYWPLIELDSIGPDSYDMSLTIYIVNKEDNKNITFLPHMRYPFCANWDIDPKINDEIHGNPIFVDFQIKNGEDFYIIKPHDYKEIKLYSNIDSVQLRSLYLVNSSINKIKIYGIINGWQKLVYSDSIQINKKLLIKKLQ